MTRATYPILSIEEFGRHLLTSGDLDPVYVALHGASLGMEQRSRWLLAYWCFYDCGVASWMSECVDPEHFWAQMMRAARNEDPTPFGQRWRRAHERRHFRGAAAVLSVEKLQYRYADPADMVAYCAWGWTRSVPSREEHPTYHAVMGRVKEHHLFGDWIAFKVADMVDRTLGTPVSFEEAEAFMFRDPVEGALRLWRHKAGLPETAMPRDVRGAIHQVVSFLTSEFSSFMAPPAGDRPVGLQEVETVLCKWKSHCNGHYPLLNDQVEIRAALQPWLPHSETARLIEAHLPGAAQ